MYYGAECLAKAFQCHADKYQPRLQLYTVVQEGAVVLIHKCVIEVLDVRQHERENYIWFRAWMFLTIRKHASLDLTDYFQFVASYVAKSIYVWIVLKKLQG